MPQVISLRLHQPPAGAPLAERSDDDLMLLVRTGMTAALAVLVDRYAARLANYVAKLLGSPPLAAEVCQETWLRVWTYRASYRAEGKFVVFLHTTARNLCKNHARSARRRRDWVHDPSSDALNAVADERPDHLDALLARERQRDVHDALGALPEPMREALVLRFQEELSYEDIAAIVGASEVTLRSRVHHGLKLLRSELTKGRKR